MGRAGGRWLDARRNHADTEAMVKVDLKHVDAKIFRIVLRHIYADTDEELFDHIVSADLEEHFDFLMDVLSVANELMLDRLAQICQSVMGRYGMSSSLNTLGIADVTSQRTQRLLLAQCCCTECCVRVQRCQSRVHVPQLGGNASRKVS